MTKVTHVKILQHVTSPFTAACIIAPLVLAITTGTAAAQDKLKLKYDFYGSKFRVLSASFDLSFDKNSYVVKSVAATKGLASMFAKSNMHYGARGIFSAKKPFPQEFQTRIEKGGKHKSAHIRWLGKNRQEITAVPKVSKKKQRDVTKALKPGFPDPLSALLNITFSAKLPCFKNIRTFDGRRIFEFRLKYLGKDTLPKGKAGAYSGQAHKCSFRNIPIAGYSRKKMKAHRKNPASAFTMWFAPLKSTATGGTIYIPVKIKGTIKSASITGILKTGTFNNLPLTAPRQAANSN